MAKRRMQFSVEIPQTIREPVYVLTLFKTTIKGNFVLYIMLQAYNILDMKVTGLTLLAVSMT